MLCRVRRTLVRYHVEVACVVFAVSAACATRTTHGFWTLYGRGFERLGGWVSAGVVAMGTAVRGWASRRGEGGADAADADSDDVDDVSFFGALVPRSDGIPPPTAAELRGPLDPACVSCAVRSPRGPVGGRRRRYLAAQLQAAEAQLEAAAEGRRDAAAESDADLDDAAAPPEAAPLPEAVADKEEEDEEDDDYLCFANPWNPIAPL